MTAQPFNITLLSVDGVGVVELSGSVFEGAAGGSDAFQPVEDHARAHAWRIALGLGGVVFLNSSGIGAILTLRTHCEQHGGKLVLYELFPGARHALVTLRLIPILSIAETRVEAVQVCLHGATASGPKMPRA